MVMLCLKVKNKVELTLCNSRGVGDTIPCISSLIRRDSQVLSDTLKEALGLGSWCRRGDWLSWWIWAPWFRWVSWLKWASFGKWASGWNKRVYILHYFNSYLVTDICYWITLMELDLFVEVGLLVQMSSLMELCGLEEQVSLVQEGISP